MQILNPYSCRSRFSWLRMYLFVFVVNYALKASESEAEGEVS
jgi:hypothetical protein